jgi:hypothetical protein
LRRRFKVKVKENFPIETLAKMLSPIQILWFLSTPRDHNYNKLDSVRKYPCKIKLLWLSGF